MPFSDSSFISLVSNELVDSIYPYACMFKYNNETTRMKPEKIDAEFCQLVI